jgi:hypothetical protein
VKKSFVLLAALAAALATAASAGAEKPGPGPIATPASVCRALADFGAYPSFEACMTRLNADVQAYMSEDDNGNLINLDQRCTQLEEGFTDPGTGEHFAVTYPFWFVEFPGFPLPEFTGVNHHQCMLILYAYHFAFSG